MMHLQRFLKPSRYLGKEFNAVQKDAPLKVALAFPDLYEVGMSHLGLKVLYDIINRLPYASAERVFHPWLDLEAYLRENSVPLAALESGRPLADFDVLGFSLQYELSYTSVLNMLSLAGLPLESRQRADSQKSKNPLVIAGGPSTVNPAPMAPFIDAFLIGDGEEAVPQMLEAVFRWKKEGDGKRADILNTLARIDGVYVPRVSRGKTRRRIISSLEEAPYPARPVVPYAQLVHDRINVEVSRGCTMGCRFCQAGMIYRPLRERTPQTVIRLAGQALEATGHEEVSFTSLSAGDYSGLLPLIREFNRRFSGRNYAVSLPSLRVKAVNENVLKEIKTVRKTGFTIAPEAATARLRLAINKDFEEEDYERAVDTLFREGWLNLKLYYMIGLPTETDEDVEAIPGMAMKALRAAKKHAKRGANITVSVSSFVPKPHTPFQWFGQESTEGLLRKKAFLRNAFRGGRVTLKGHDERLSLLEAAFARGDESLSTLLLAAHRRGARLDAWSDVFNYNAWLDAAAETGIDIAACAQRTFCTSEHGTAGCKDEHDQAGEPGSLPWGHVDTGIKGSFLLNEYRKALGATEKTPDCRVKCTSCGLACGVKSIRTDLTAGSGAGLTAGQVACGEATPDALHQTAELIKNKTPFKLRVEFSKTDPLGCLSHRELITAMARAMRRAGLPVEYSEGFHPAPKVAFGPPLGVGVQGTREYLDMTLSCYMPPLRVAALLNAQLPAGIKVQAAAPLPERAPSLQSFITVYVYEIIGVDCAKAAPFMAKSEFLVEREDRREDEREKNKDRNKNKKSKQVDIRRMVMRADIAGSGFSVELWLRDDPEGPKARLEEILTGMFGAGHQAQATRTRLLGEIGGAFLPPMDN
ncbi:MAG: TIGR03960 family B12-binding radical SAM protein [Nitrospiraceae bacterium]|nr:TIGR03960 family B12-binding radical SAM protein [Nitrospiraceae bacterium]